MKVPPLDLAAQFELVGKEIEAAVAAVMATHAYCNGPAVRELEAQMAAYCGCVAGVGVSSGTDALLCSLMALEIGPGDEVITTPFTFFGTAGAVWRVGARPVFVDIVPDTFHIDPDRIEAAITERTRAILPVHLYGQMADMEAVMAVAGRHGLAVIEDCAQAIGAVGRGRKAGSVGTAGCLSFYPTKTLGAMGDAGMIVTRDEDLAARMSAIRLHGETERYYHRYVGGNFRMDSIQAAALTVKLGYLDRWIQRRQAHAARYGELLAGVEGVVTPAVRPENVHTFNYYVVRVPGRRDELRAHLAAHDIATAIYYPLSLHQQECFRSLGHAAGDFPESERAAAETLALPMFPELTDEQIAHVAGTISDFLA